MSWLSRLRPPGPLALTRRRVLVIVGALMPGMILASLDQTVVATVDRPGKSCRV